MTATTQELWLSSPLVTYARHRAGSEASPVDVLSELSSLMNELEERCPGVPFGEILAGAKVDASFEEAHRSAEAVLSMGLELCEVQDLIPNYEPPVEEHRPTRNFRGNRPAVEPALIRADRARGMTPQQISDKWGITVRTVFRYLSVKAGETRLAVAAGGVVVQGVVAATRAAALIGS